MNGPSIKLRELDFPVGDRWQVEVWRGPDIRFATTFKHRKHATVYARQQAESYGTVFVLAGRIAA